MSWNCHSSLRPDLFAPPAVPRGTGHGRRVIGTNAADTGPDGTVYFVGAIEVHEKPGAAPELAGKIAGVPYRLALLSYKPRP